MSWLPLYLRGCDCHGARGAQLIRKRKFPLLRTLLPIAQGAAAAAPGLLANAVLRRQRESVELLVWSLLRDCEPSARATTLLNGVKGMNDISRPLLARLIQYYPASMAMALNDSRTIWSPAEERIVRSC